MRMISDLMMEQLRKSPCEAARRAEYEKEGAAVLDTLDRLEQQGFVYFPPEQISNNIVQATESETLADDVVLTSDR
jgi:hypothetical protein